MSSAHSETLLQPTGSTQIRSVRTNRPRRTRRPRQLPYEKQGAGSQLAAYAGI